MKHCQTKIRIRSLFMLVALLGLMMFSNTAAARPSNWFIRGMVGDASFLNPVLASDVNSSDINNLIFNGLIGIDEDYELYGDLADSWEITQMSTVFLKDGAEFDSTAVVQMIKEKTAGDPAMVDLIDSLEVLSPTRLVIHLSAADSEISTRLTGIIPEDVWEPIIYTQYYIKLEQFFDSNQENPVESKEIFELFKKHITPKVNQEKFENRILGFEVQDTGIFQIYTRGRIDNFSELFKDTLQISKYIEKENEVVKRTIDQPIFVFNLRRDVIWHDGEPFTADDVVYTFERYVDPKVQTVRGSLLDAVEKIEKIDKWTVKATYKRPYAGWFITWGLGIVPKHIFENEPDFNSSEFNRNPIGTGPFLFVSWSSDEEIILESNPEYWLGESEIRKIIVQIIPEAATRFQKLKARELDFSELTPEQYEMQTGDEEFLSHYKKYRYTTPSYSYIGWNQDGKNPFFQDKRVRQAMTYAINRQEIVNAVFLGYGTVATGPFHPQSWAYNQDIQPLDYNSEKAAQLLSEAGWTDSDGDGIRDKMINGQKVNFSFTLVTYTGSSETQNAIAMVKNDLSRIGVNMEIKMMEWSTFLKEHVNQKNFEAVYLGWYLGADADTYSIWHSDSIERGFNRVAYRNEEVDRLTIKARETLEQEKRAQYYQRIHELIAEDCPYTFMFVRDDLNALHTRFIVDKISPLGGIWRHVDSLRIEPAWRNKVID